MHIEELPESLNETCQRMLVSISVGQTQSEVATRFDSLAVARLFTGARKGGRE